MAEVSTTMKHRKLRIAWSLAWGIVAVLLIALWLRSYWRADWVIWVYSTARGTEVEIFDGYIEINTRYFYVPGDRVEWRLNQSPGYAPVLWKHGLRYKPGTIDLPIWLLIILATALGLAPWLSIKRFSIRTLLIATTLAAIGLGLIAWATK